jgi:hypothetical protein
VLKNPIHIVLFTFLILTLSCQLIQEEDQDPFLQLLNPNGGEIFNELDTVSITWTSEGEVDDNVKLLYSKDAGISWQNVVPSHPNDGAYTWTIPNVTETYDSCKVKIIERYGEYEDVSDGYFTIAADSTYFRITSPNGGETWDELSTQTITWEGSGDYELVPNSNAGEGRVDIHYSLDLGISWERVNYYVTLNNGSYEWQLPEIYVTCSNALVKVTRCTGYQPSISCNSGLEDVSDLNFTINAGDSQSNFIQLLTPNGGETWHEQTSQEITWFTTGDIGGNDLTIKYRLDYLDNWTFITGSTPNDGSYDWLLPNISDIADYCLIGIWSVADENIYKTSDDFFTIIPDSSYYSIQQPNGGEILQSGEEYQILWTSGGDVGSVEIYYSIFGGESWYLIDDNEANDGSFIWSVPSVQGTNDACKIKIQSRDRDDWFDISDADFTISNN